MRSEAGRNASAQGKRAATAARGERDRSGGMRAGFRSSRAVTLPLAISANPPRAAVAARYSIVFPVPGVFASLGTLSTLPWPLPRRVPS